MCADVHRFRTNSGYNICDPHLRVDFGKRVGTGRAYQWPRRMERNGEHTFIELLAMRSNLLQTIKSVLSAQTYVPHLQTHALFHIPQT
jgi:hypothetical protein